MENDSLKNMHAQIDDDYAQALAELDKERERRHKLLDELFAPWLRSAGVMPFPKEVTPEPEQFIAESELPQKGDDLDDDDFPNVESMRGRIRSVVVEIDDDVDIYLARVYKMFARKYPEMMSEVKPVNLRAQISTVLTKLYKKRELRLVKKGTGGIPNIYRKVKKNTAGEQAEIAFDSAVVSSASL